MPVERGIDRFSGKIPDHYAFTMSRLLVKGGALVGAALLVLAGCTSTPVPAPTPSASRIVDPNALESAIDTKLKSGSVGWSTIDAVLVSVEGQTKVAHYRNGSKPQDALHVWSVTKSVVSALIGIAIEEKVIPSLDATLVDLLPRYQKSMTADEKEITLRQLMTMTAGFPGDSNIHEVFEQRTDPVPTILAEGLHLEPGSVFEYSSRSSHLVSAVLRDALARADGDNPRTVLEYAQAKLFGPLAIKSTGAHEKRVLLSDPSYDVLTRFDWGTDAAGLHTACCMLRIRPADMIKLGELYLGLGVWQGKRILPAGWVEQTVASHELSSQYGLMWWMDIDPHGHPAWLARGSEGQLIAVVPEHNLVVAVGSVPTEHYSAGSDVSFLLTEVIAPAFG